MGTGTQAHITLPAYLVLWERRNAALDKQTAAHTAWIFSPPGSDEEAARWTAYSQATREAGQLVIDCYKMGEALMAVREDKPTPTCPRCGERINPDEGGFCEGCFQHHPM